MRERLATSPAQDVWVELFKNIFTALYIYIRKERKWACFCLFCFLFCISLFEFSAKVPFESNWIHVQNWVKVVIIRDRRRIKFSPLLGWGSHIHLAPMGLDGCAHLNGSEWDQYNKNVATFLLLNLFIVWFSLKKKTKKLSIRCVIQLTSNGKNANYARFLFFFLIS